MFSPSEDAVSHGRVTILVHGKAGDGREVRPFLC